MSRNEEFHGARSSASMEDVGVEVDTQAPNYYPETTRRANIVLHPDDEVIATQKAVNTSHPAVSGFKKSKAGPIELISSDGALYVNDGHHRLYGARKAGKSLKATVWYGEDY